MFSCTQTAVIICRADNPFKNEGEFEEKVVISHIKRNIYVNTFVHVATPSSTQLPVSAMATDHRWWLGNGYQAKRSTSNLCMFFPFCCKRAICLEVSCFSFRPQALGPPKLVPSSPCNSAALQLNVGKTENCSWGQCSGIQLLANCLVSSSF